jgi:Sec-independent protein secretion pathway component TatC
MVIALSSVAATLGLVIVFFVVFPALVQGLLMFIAAQVIGERAENQRYLSRRRVGRSQG